MGGSFRPLAAQVGIQFRDPHRLKDDRAHSVPLQTLGKRRAGTGGSSHSAVAGGTGGHRGVEL